MTATKKPTPTATKQATASPTKRPTPTPTKAPTPTPTPTKVPTNPPTSEPSSAFKTPEAALEAALDQFSDYGNAGPCSDPIADTGYCYKKVQQTPTKAVFLIGPVDSEATEWVLIEKTGGYWQVTDGADYNGESTPPF